MVNKYAIKFKEDMFSPVFKMSMLAKSEADCLYILKLEFPKMVLVSIQLQVEHENNIYYVDFKAKKLLRIA